MHPSPENTVGYAEAITLLKKAYHHFNARDIDGTLSTMHTDVEWPNGMEGGVEKGHEAVRSYWKRQWVVFNPNVEPLHFAKEEDGQINVTVHQVVHDMEGNLLADQLIHHVYTIDKGLIRSMEIRK